MAKTQVPCIAIESCDAGEVRWYIDGKTCQQKFDALVADNTLNQSTITRFELTVDDDLDPDRITRIVDQAMWDMDYVPLQRRQGSEMADNGKPRYQTQQWMRIHSGSLEEGFKQHLIEQEAPQQKAFSDLMERYAGNPVGIECRSASRMAWAFVCPNVQTEYSKMPWRIQSFDENGMVGHECYKTFLDAVESMVGNYPVQDAGALDRVAATPAWTIGLRVQEVRDLLNRGLIGFAEFTNRCREICNVRTGESQYEAF
ncbi:hypothetical protein [Polaromonas aquatica]|uniref:Uncharacterized protein n=1 Tax=Polaromonas aquatica TaxID=332657 RepID=A0ABW1TXJ3_9BURK